MKDFVLLNPKYKRTGNEKELADLLLVLNDKCIVISVKGTDGKPKDQPKLKGWLTKKTFEGSKQAKGGINWVSKVSFAAQNLWEEERSIEPNDLHPLCGIVLLECSQQPFGSIEFDIKLPQSDVPIHVLSLNDFLNVVNWLGSISDVFRYFSKRGEIRHIFTGINQERPILAYYTLRSHNLAEILSEDKSEIEKLPELHQLHLMSDIERYNERDRLARYINSIVHQLHTRHPSPETFIPTELAAYYEPLEKRRAYLKMATMLNALPISNKVWIGRELEKLLAKLRNSGQGGCFAFKPLQSDIIFVFAGFSKISRTDRIRSIGRILPAALYKYGGTEGLAIGFDADDSETGYDLIWIRDYINLSEGDIELGELLFPTPLYTQISDAFGTAKPYQSE